MTNNPAAYTSMMGFAVLGAVNAYELYGNLLLKNPTQLLWVQLMQNAANFVTKLYSQDATIQAVISGFQTVAKFDTLADIQQSFPAFLTWWTKAKGTTLTGAPTALRLGDWIEQNRANFGQAALSSKDSLSYNLYSDLFFMHLFSTPLASDIDPYLATPRGDQTKPLMSAQIQLLQLYNYYDTDPKNPFDPYVNPVNWAKFVLQVQAYYAAVQNLATSSNYQNFIGSSTNKQNLYTVTNAIVNGICPDTYNSFRDYLTSLLTSEQNVNSAFWGSSWASVNTDLNNLQDIATLFYSCQSALAGSGSATDIKKMFMDADTLFTTPTPPTPPSGGPPPPPQPPPYQQQYGHLFSLAPSLLTAIQGALDPANLNCTYEVFLPDINGMASGTAPPYDSGPIQNLKPDPANPNQIPANFKFYIPADPATPPFGPSPTLWSMLGQGNDNNRVQWLPGSGEIQPFFLQTAENYGQFAPVNTQPTNWKAFIMEMGFAMSMGGTPIDQIAAWGGAPVNGYQSPGANGPYFLHYIAPYYGPGEPPYPPIPPQGQQPVPQFNTYSLQFNGILTPSQCTTMSISAANTKLADFITSFPQYF